MDLQTNLARVVGVVLTVVGVVGFFTESTLWIFGVNTLHNLVHLASGLAGLVVGFSAGAKAFNKWFGVIYLAVGALGFIIPALLSTLLNINTADNVLHLALGLVLAGVGFFNE
jgi:preprotein translocase subunit Sss1